MQDVFKLSYFKSLRDTEPAKALSLREVAETVRSCPQLRKDTDYICTQYRAGILGQFAGKEKQPYQDDKRRLLPAIAPAGEINSRAKDATLSIKPSGLLCLDIDENKPAELRSFYKDVQAGKLDFAALAFLSPSGALNGSFALFLQIELPKAFAGIPAKLRKRLQLDKREPWTVTLDKLNKAYHQAFTFVLKRDKKINVGKAAGQNLKSARYLAFDPQAYLNEAAKVYTLQTLAAALEQADNQQKEIGFTLDALDIDADTWTSFAEQFAEQKGYTLTNGQKHNYLNSFAIAANLLGVHRDQVQQYAASKGIKVGSNCISSPYKAYKESFALWSYRLEQNKLTNLVKGSEGQKLTDLLQPEQIFNKWLIAPTGSGKTFFVAQIPDRKVIICPTLALVENVCKEYGAEPFTGKSKDLEAIKTAPFIATTYASFRKLSAYLWEQREAIRVFIDEAHNTTAATSPGYQLKQIREVLNAAQSFKSITLLTGTYAYNHCPQLRNLERATVEIPRPKKQLIYTDAADTIKAAALAIKASISAGRFPLVLFDNANEKGRLGTLQSLLKDVHGLKYFSSHTKQDEEFKQLVSDGYISSDVCGIVTTSVLKEGNNIYNESSFDIIILGSYHSLEIEQFSNRPRRAKDIKINKIRSDKRQTSPNGFSPERFAEYLEKKALEACKELNYQDAPQCGTDAYIKEHEARQAVSGNPIYQDENGAYQVDYLRLSNMVFEEQKRAENRNQALQLRALEKYGIIYEGTVDTKAEQTPDEKQATSEVRAAAKAAELEQWNDVLNDLATKEDPLEYATEQINTNSQNLGKTEKAVLSRFKALRAVVPNEAGIIEQLKDIGPKKAKFVLLLKRLKVATVHRDKNYLATNRKFAIVLKAINKAFDGCDLLSSQEIADKLRRCLALDKSFNLDYLEQEQRTDRYLNIARIFFELERKDSRDEAGQKVNSYKICPLTFDKVFNNPTKVRVQNSSLSTAYLIK